MSLRRPGNHTRLSSKATIERAIKLGQIDKTDGEAVLDFVEEYTIAKNVSVASAHRYYYGLRAFLAELAAQKLVVANLTKKDGLRLFKFLKENTAWGEATKEDYWVRWCIFFKWYSKERGKAWNEEVKALFIGEDKLVYRRNKNNIPEQPWVQPSDLLRILEAEEDIGFKTFFATLFLSGCRNCEIRTLRIKDVTRNAHGTYSLHLQYSKTEKRVVPLIDPNDGADLVSPYLAKWLALHPRSNDPEAWLFMNSQGRPVSVETANKRLRKLLAKIGMSVKKGERITGHAFRRGRATDLAGKGLSSFQMNKMMGWSTSSTVSSRYVNRAGIDLTKALMQAHGVQQEIHSMKMEGQVCLHCKKTNSYTAEFCENCRLPLDPKRLEEMKKGVDALHLESVAKRLLEEKYADIIQTIRAEIRKEGQQ